MVDFNTGDKVRYKVGENPSNNNHVSGMVYTVAYFKDRGG